VFTLTLVENDLHTAEAQTDQSNPDVIDAESFRDLAPLHVSRIANEKRGQDQGKDPDGNVDVKNPAPGEIVGNPSAKPGTDSRRDHDGYPVDCERHAALFQRERVVKNGLLAWLQTATTHALQNAEQDKHAEARSQAAQERANRK